jgi:DNA-binding PadR family transcriptional regulator
MSIRYSLLAILDAGPRYGYALKNEFESATGSVWPLNVGQVYSTLGRLERDGLVLVAEDGDGQKTYRISDSGRNELRHWFATPVVRDVVPRQELAIKLVFAMRAGPEQVREVVRHQLVATMRSLQDFTSLKAKAESDGDLAWLMMLDALIFQAEAESRWLELCEARLAQAHVSATRPARGAPSGYETPDSYVAGAGAASRGSDTERTF